MQHDTWQQLLSLESRDIVAMWFMKIHARELNARRAKEITAAAKQAREFFRNSHASDNSVKPLLTLYGVASRPGHSPCSFDVRAAKKASLEVMA